MPKVLIVDDEPDNIELLGRRLTRRGYTVSGAGSADEGIAKAHAEAPDIILMDIKMPQVDGLEATRQLKFHAATRSIPIITLTAHAMAEDRAIAIAAGADDYESKPVDLPKLLEKMDALLASKAASP
jgi:CheY-like chemotaxis protein